MRLRTVGGLIAAMAALHLAAGALVYAQAPPAPAPAPAPTPQPAGSRAIKPGAGMAGISVGTSLRGVIARFGAPSEVRQTTIDFLHLFNRFGITVYSQREIVTAVLTTNSLLKIDDVLGVGFRVESAIAAFGRGYRQGPVDGYPGIVYDDRGIAFGMDGTAIAAIMVFRPGTTVTISGLQPGPIYAVTPNPAPGGYPVVAGLKPFAAETNYMSLPGYLRWTVYQTSAIWIGYKEAASVVADQQGSEPAAP